MAETIFHVVHSIKGGCGKTAFSLFRAMEFAEEAEKTNNGDDKARVLFLDADFKGTGLDVLIYAKEQKDFIGNRDVRLEDLEDAGERPVSNTTLNSFLFRRKYNGNRLNDYLNGKIHELHEVVTESGVVSRDLGKGHEKIESVTAFNGYLDFILSSASLKNRGHFAYQKDSQPVMTVGRFRIKMRRLLQQICDRTLADGEKQYKHVVIDMPAGYDEYSDVFLGVLRQYCKDIGEGKIKYYAVTTADKSHFDAMLEDVKEAKEDDREYGKYESILVVFSEIQKTEFSDDKLREYISRLETEAGDQIETIKCVYQPDYNTFCRTDSKTCFPYELISI